MVNASSCIGPISWISQFHILSVFSVVSCNCFFINFGGGYCKNGSDKSTPIYNRDAEPPVVTDSLEILAWNSALWAAAHNLGVTISVHQQYLNACCFWSVSAICSWNTVHSNMWLHWCSTSELITTRTVNDKNQLNIICCTANTIRIFWYDYYVGKSFLQNNKE